MCFLSCLFTVRRSCNRNWCVKWLPLKEALATRVRSANSNCLQRCLSKNLFFWLVSLQMSIIGDSMIVIIKRKIITLSFKKNIQPTFHTQPRPLTSCCAADIPLLQLMTVSLILEKSKANWLVVSMEIERRSLTGWQWI